MIALILPLEVWIVAFCISMLLTVICSFRKDLMLSLISIASISFCIMTFSAVGSLQGGEMIQYFPLASSIYLLVVIMVVNLFYMLEIVITNIDNWKRKKYKVGNK